MAPIDDQNYLNETDEHPRFEDMIIMDQRVAVKESKASCSDSRKLAEEFIKEKVVSTNLDLHDMNEQIFFLFLHPLLYTNFTNILHVNRTTIC